jgi:SAM-dependent methyltransferase
VFAEFDRAHLFRAWVGFGKDVLDLGCRYGALTKAYLVSNRVVGVDVDSDALGHAARLGIRPVHHDIEEGLPFGEGSFDVVVAGELLEHVRAPDQLVEEVLRVLRPGGTFVGSTPNAYRLKNRLRVLAGRRPDFADDAMCTRFYSGDDVLGLLAPFDSAEARYLASRFIGLSPRLFGNVIAFRARKRR